MGQLIKIILLLVILSLSLVVTVQADENFNTNSFNISIVVKNMTGVPIADADIEVIDPSGAHFFEKTDSKGMTSAQISPGQVNIVIKADEYESLNASLNVTENANYNFYLNYNVIPWIIFLNSIILMLPVFTMLYVIIRKKTKRWYYPPLSWALSFVILLIISFYTNKFNIYFLNPDLDLPLFVPIVAFIGATSYVTVSYLKKKEEKPKPEDWDRIYFSYGRRLFIAPYIAMIALFTITDVIEFKTPWAIVFFAYFVGAYTKAIEGTLKEIGKKFLTEKQKNDISKREMQSSEIVKKLDASLNIAHKLDAVGISKVCDLRALPDAKIKEIAEKTEIDELYLKALKEEAVKQAQDLQTMDKTKA